MGFREMKIEELEFNPFERIGKQWTLITAGNEQGMNTMTASWGGAGVLWGKPVATVYIRPQRYTKEFVDREGRFTLSFYGEEYRKVLSLMGKISGKDSDKIGESGLTPWYCDNTAAFEEAELVLVCRTLYTDEIKPENFLDQESEKTWYPAKDYHTMYIAEIEKVYVKE